MSMDPKGLGPLLSLPNAPQDGTAMSSWASTLLIQLRTVLNRLFSPISLNVYTVSGALTKTYTMTPSAPDLT